jgi:hypothetical protein
VSRDDMFVRRSARPHDAERFEPVTITAKNKP